MKYHKQEHLFKPNVYPPGSCMSTVDACLLDLELSEVPNYSLVFFELNFQKNNLELYAKQHYLKNKEYNDESLEDYRKENFDNFMQDSSRLWHELRTMWLASMGYTEDWIADIDKWLMENPERHYIASGISPRGVGHVVIYQNNKMVHDPHPSNQGLTKVEDFKYLRKIEGDYEFDRYYIKLKKKV